MDELQDLKNLGMIKTAKSSEKRKNSVYDLARNFENNLEEKGRDADVRENFAGKLEKAEI